MGGRVSIFSATSLGGTLSVCGTSMDLGSVGSVGSVESLLTKKDVHVEDIGFF